MASSARLVGDWKGAGMVLRNLAMHLVPVLEAKVYETGEFIVQRMRDHIDSQDLNWEPLTQHTINLKHGNDMIYVDTGWLKENLSVRRLKNNPRGSTIFVGASPWKTHPESGLRFSDLMIFMEYGTSQMVARPLVRPTYEEALEYLKNNNKNIVIEALKGMS